MLFRKNIEPACAYCQYSSPVDDESVICSKKGIMQPWSKCRKFSYDPLKRVPAAQPKPSTRGVDPSSFDI